MNLKSFIYQKWFDPKGILESEFQSWWRKEVISSQKVLLLLDGYDELSSEISLSELLSSYDSFHILITSRPYSTPHLPDYQRLEITGFTDANITQYVHHCLPPALANQLLQFFRHHPSIYGVAHIPIQLDLLCTLWQDLSTSAKTLKTMTAVYYRLEKLLLRRSLQQLGALQPFSDREVEEKTAPETRYLSQLAFLAIQQENLLIPRSLIEETAQKFPQASLEKVLQLGLFKELDTKEYYFLHLTFQEYYAARHLIFLFKENKTVAHRFINEQKYNPRLQIVFWFTAGLCCLEDSIHTNTPPLIDQLLAPILEEPRDLIGLYETQLVVRLLEEGGFPQTKIGKAWEKNTVSWTKKIFEGYIDLSDNKARTFNSYVIARIVIANGALHSMKPFLQLSPDYVERFCLPLLKYASPNQEDRQNACTIVNVLGITNPIVISALLSSLKDPDKFVRKAACKALENLEDLSSEGISVLLSSLKDPDERVREVTCRALGTLKDPSPDVISALLSWVKDSVHFVRSNVCKALGNIKDLSPDIISALLSSLKDSDKNVRQTACKALGNIKDPTPEMISSLLSFFKNSDEMIRWTACEALGNIKDPTSEMISSLLSFFKNSDEMIRWTACQVFVNLKVSTPNLISSLLPSLNSPDVKVRQTACSALGNIKDPTPEMISSLLSSLKDPDERVRESAYWALGKLKDPTPEVIAAFLSSVKDPDERVRAAVCQDLGNIKDPTPEMISALFSFLKDPDYVVRWIACEVLKNLRNYTPEMISALFSSLKDSDEEVRRASCEALGNIKNPTPDVISALFFSLKDSDEEVRQTSCKALGNIKNPTPDVISVLFSSLKDSDEEVRRASCKALGNIKNPNPDVISALFFSLKDSDEEVRQTSCKALGNIKNPTPDVISVLFSSLKDPDEGVRQAAHECLIRLKLLKMLSSSQFNFLIKSSEKLNNLTLTLALHEFLDLCCKHHVFNSLSLQVILSLALQEQSSIYLHQGKLFSWGKKGLQAFVPEGKNSLDFWTQKKILNLKSCIEKEIEQDHPQSCCIS